MTIETFENRVRLRSSLNTSLSFLTDDALARLIRPVVLRHPAWGGNGVVNIEGTSVFVKRIPITSMELANPYSTRNRYQLPTYYSYGIGSAGFGAWREIASAIQASNWVLEDACPSFPLLYHYRILRRRGRHARLVPDDHDGYIEYWNDNSRIRRFIESRHAATHDAVLFLEYFPHTLRPWFLDNLSNAPRILAQFQKLTDFLRSRGVVHFDCHHANIVTDGEALYLTDFGLALNQDFELSPTEQSFLAGNTFTDIGTFVFRYAEYLAATYRQRPKATRAKIRGVIGVREEPDSLILEKLIMENLTELLQRGLLPLDEAFVDQIAKWKDVILLMWDFYRRLIFDNRKRARLDNDQLGRLVATAR